MDVWMNNKRDSKISRNEKNRQVNTLLKWLSSDAITTNALDMKINNLNQFINKTVWFYLKYAIV